VSWRRWSRSCRHPNSPTGHSCPATHPGTRVLGFPASPSLLHPGSHPLGPSCWLRLPSAASLKKHGYYFTSFNHKACTNNTLARQAAVLPTVGVYRSIASPPTAAPCPETRVSLTQDPRPVATPDELATGCAPRSATSGEAWPRNTRRSGNCGAPSCRHRNFLAELLQVCPPWPSLLSKKTVAMRTPFCPTEFRSHRACPVGAKTPGKFATRPCPSSAELGTFGAGPPRVAVLLPLSAGIGMVGCRLRPPRRVHHDRVTAPAPTHPKADSPAPPQGDCRPGIGSTVFHAGLVRGCGTGRHGSLRRDDPAGRMDLRA